MPFYLYEHKDHTGGLNDIRGFNVKQQTAIPMAQLHTWTTWFFAEGIPIVGCDCKVCCSLDCRDKRLRSAVHISSNKSIIIDAGFDFRQQVLREQIDKLDAILFTHEHKDLHTGGLK